MRLQWTEIEAHQAAVTEAEWRRVQAYFRRGEPLKRISHAEGLLREGGARLAKTRVIFSIGSGCRKLLRVMLNGRLTWTDVEAHRHAATALQWRRLSAVFHEGKTALQVAIEEGRPVRGRRTWLISFSMGRGCIAVMDSMLGRSVRVLQDKADILHGAPLAAEGPPIDAPRIVAAPSVAEPADTQVAKPTRTQRSDRKKRPVKSAKPRTQPNKRWMMSTPPAPIAPAVAHAEDPAEPQGALALALRAAFAHASGRRRSQATGHDGGLE